MSVNSYLVNLANAAVLRDAEKTSIQRSITALQSRINTHFSGTHKMMSKVDRHIIFGSYTRGTILPRNFDEQSDVDYMIVFDDTTASPQTYLNRLRRFVEVYYSRSEIKQSNPTIVLDLNHIKFELVPAIEKYIWGLQIPAKASSSNDWISTAPNSFNESLTKKNQEYSNLIKPLTRLAKYWNANNGYPFASFELEQMVVAHEMVVAHDYDGIEIFGIFSPTRTLWDHFKSFMSSLEVGWSAPQWKKDAIKRLDKALSEMRGAENTNDPIRAEMIMRHLLPKV